MKPVRDWYRKLFTRIEVLPEAERIPALIAVMALEGFFYTHKFGVDLMAPGMKDAAWDYMTEHLVADAGRKSEG